MASEMESCGQGSVVLAPAPSLTGYPTLAKSDLFGHPLLISEETVGVTAKVQPSTPAL